MSAPEQLHAVAIMVFCSLQDKRSMRCCCLRTQPNVPPLLLYLQGRTLEDSIQQLFLQQQEQLHLLTTPHSQGWQLDGCVAAPPAAFPSADQQLLYVNKQLISCPVLQQLLRDWFTRSWKAYQASNQVQGGHSYSNRMKVAEPGYVLLITCPASAVLLTQRGGTAGQAQADFNPSMQQLLQLLQAAIGPAWGSMPSAWRGAAASGGGRSSGTGSGGSRTRHRRSGTVAAAPDDAGAELQQRHATQQHGQEQQQQLCSKPAALLPVHGLQLSSRTRSLAASIASTQVRLVDVFRQLIGKESPYVQQHLAVLARSCRGSVLPLLWLLSWWGCAHTAIPQRFHLLCRLQRKMPHVHHNQAKPSHSMQDDTATSSCSISNSQQI
jgi:hypothetical protein